jgi:hypothetical protein
VFEDVGHAGRVHRHRREGDQKDIFVMVGADVEVTGAGAAVAVLIEQQLECRNRMLPHEFEAGMGQGAGRRR